MSGQDVDDDRLYPHRLPNLQKFSRQKKGQLACAIPPCQSFSPTLPSSPVFYSSADSSGDEPSLLVSRDGNGAERGRILQYPNPNPAPALRIHPELRTDYIFVLHPRSERGTEIRLDIRIRIWKKKTVGTQLKKLTD
ncbi:hypothetical protein RHGRI_031396 [Rhododendron griersonianum]|uniref:Uncharacterized protein n=1 Tax=Rhododendron griersonianum TaxID=479676 RepID=A0AAV6I868_9ERIC|nr:hypothetical protein RHGRI_031396 [Rhododendron griersonianum]